MRLYVNIDMAGAAFERRPEAEIEHILRHVIDCVKENGIDETSCGSYPLRDTNGNTIGTYGFARD